MLTGENGLLTKATESKEETRGAAVQEAKDLWKMNKEADKHTETSTAESLETLLTNLGPDGQKLLTAEDIAEINKTGQVKIGKRTIVFKEVEPSITEYVKVGDYIDYDPTRGVTDTSKLSYTSPTGTATEHGNGYTSSETGGGQKFTAKSTAVSGIKWRVLSVTDNKIEIIPATLIKKDATDQNFGSFVLNGARGYLYAEQELNEVCKIYGYGYGADTSGGSTFKVGGPAEGEETTRTITGTGARSITVEDINKIAGVYEDQADGKMKYSDGTVINSDYGSTTNPTSNVKYPTINTSLGDSTTGISSSAGVKSLKSTTYNYYKEKITNPDIQNMLFYGGYWLASRNIGPLSSSVYFDVRYVRGGRSEGVSSVHLCNSGPSEFNENPYIGYAVFPVVSLKSNVIDISSADENSGKDGYAWNLK